LYVSGGFQRILQRRAKRGEVCVLGLHRILTESQVEQSYSEPAIVLKQATFEAFCEFVAEHFDVVPLQSVLRDLAERGSAKPRCVITFDDGWADNYSTALPVLQRFQFPVTIFLATAMMDSDSTFWVERVRAYAADPGSWRELRAGICERIGKSEQEVALSDVTEYFKRMSSERRDEVIAELIGDLPQAGASDRMLSWQQVSEMSRAGVVFESHTDTHPLLPYEPLERIRLELRLAQQKLREHGAPAPCGFAYPNGSWNDAVRSLVRETGYTCAVTTQAGWFAPGQDVYSMRRVLLHEGNVTGADGRFSPPAAGLTLMGWR
jgi:peptidoglycan/xylan/chitin deacetylase (PgdA/CDA1 family)